MLIEFSVGNFRSFKDIQTLSMLATSFQPADDVANDRCIISTPFGFNLLKSKAIYGANASGKSNLVKALFTFLRIVQESVRDENILSKTIQPFLLSTETEREPTFFQIIVILGEVQYRYGFEATDKYIASEWLFMKSLTKKKVREIPLFVREKQEITPHEKHFREGRVLLETDLFKENILFLRASALFIGKESIAKQVFDYLMLIIVAEGDKTTPLHSTALQYLGNTNLQTKILQMLQVADTGIENIDSAPFPRQNIPEHLRKSALSEDDMMRMALTLHNVYDAEKNLIRTHFFLLAEDESRGTNKIFEYSPILLKALEDARPIIIDEIEASLHRRLTKKIIDLFHSSTNQSSQIIFTTHDVTLLSENLLRRDQISFVEKDSYGASRLYTLSDFKGVRKGAIIDKEYMRGKYGAVPFVGDFDAIFEKEA